ncbi:MAG TPA: response regulator [Steroidobacteraceae bacterium]|nr:response regulator [Steroidobacteraceae bacterium]
MNARLVIVDDEVANVRALCDTLHVEGYHVQGFSSPTEALRSLTPGECDLLLTDLMMPEMGGIQLIREARAKDPDIASVIMTGFGTIDTAVSAMQIGALDYVLKPLRMHTVLPAINRALDIRRLRIEHAQLQQREREQTRALAEAYQDLESFSYSISHDLRSPLRAIRGMTEMYLEDCCDSLSDQSRRRLGQVIRGAERMDQMIEDLLKFCRLSRTAPVLSPIALTAMVRRIIEELRSADPQRSVDIAVQSLPDCLGAPGLIEQVITNLLSNAFKFTRDRSDARIEVGSYLPAPPETQVPVYFVRDNGAGFDMTYADKLFGVFQRLHSQDQFPGTGVGLSIVRRILERHGGRIWAESRPGQGATFYFIISPGP